MEAVGCPWDHRRIHKLQKPSLAESIGFSLVNNSDVSGVGIFPSGLVVNIHPALAHALDCDCPAIYFHVISVDCGEGHFCGSVSSPPFNQ